MARPGGALASRPLNFFWVVDCSGSMKGKKIGTVNNAIQEVIPDMCSAADGNPNAQVMIQTLRFATGASWMEMFPVKLEEFVWRDLSAGGWTDMGKAFGLLSEQLSMPPMSTRALPPVIVLLSDGQATDEYKPALEKLLRLPWGRKSVKIAISIGEDADEDMLLEFTGNPEYVLHAHNARQLTDAIKWASTAVEAVSAPASQLYHGELAEDVPQNTSNVMLNLETKPKDEVSIADVVW